ncbi:hypothetical protein [Serratia marcescens]|uniref:hypothetical protein n=1 Tax=Serratia marcescens TaxID=615 RepID=UPI00112ABD16|nr:hypothetical protein [Serratia marcescens]MDS0777873.1 hypothetical protein [Serratia marcescens]TPV64981.1 hypothetical protein FJ699_18725 [Serratia marcescens]BEM19285.1 hypothetical protein SMCM5_22870 [Serratia marcescens]BEN26291.1 hypothetical protein SMKC032_23860 [Serratia marcescens]
MHGINSGKNYYGYRDPVPFTIWTPESLFAAHKARVTAGGGIIPDEAGCLARFRFIVDNGLLDRIVTWINPAFGVKKNASNQIEKLFALRGSDFTAQMQKSGAAVLYDDSGAAPAAVVQITSAGGGYLVSENVTVQRGDAYLIGAKLSDKNRADVLGLTVGQSLNNLPMAYARTMIQNQQAITEAWRYGTRDSDWKNGNPTGGPVGAARMPYDDYIPSAGLFDVVHGKVDGYESGKLVNSAVSTTGKLADLSAQSAPIYVGGGFAGGEVGACYGTLREAVFLHTATKADASLISRL